MPEGILREGGRLVFGSVILEKFIGCELDRFPPLFAGFLFDDLAVARLQPLTLAALLRDGLRLAGGAGGAPVPLPVQLELVMIEPAVFENAHLLVCSWPSGPTLTSAPFITSVVGNSQVETLRGRPRSCLV